MFGTIPVSLANVLSVLLINLMIIGGALLTFKLLWIDSYDFVFPKGNTETEEGHYSVEEVLEDDSDTLVASNLSTYAKIIQKILTDLDAEYWMKYTGFDGTQY